MPLRETPSGSGERNANRDEFAPGVHCLLGHDANEAPIV
jgi:hypothetical protein